MYGYRDRFNLSDFAGGATLVVAASDSSVGAKDGADYVCDGVADEVEIQAALDALPSGGGKVLCMEGTYTFTSSLEIPGDNIELEFAYGNSVKIIASGHSLSSHTVHTDAIDYLILADTRDNIKVKGIRMDWEAGAGQSKFTVAAGDSYAGMIFDTCTQLIVDDCHVDNVVRNGSQTSARQWGILFVDCSDFTCMHSEGNTCGYEGIGVRANCTQGNIDHCRGEGSYAHAIEIATWSPTLGQGSGPTDIVCNNNTCGSATTDDLIVHGIEPGMGTARIAFVGNAVSRIKVFGEINGCVVANNAFFGTATANVMVNNAAESGDDCVMQNVLIAGNVIDFADGSTQPSLGGIQISSQTNNSTAGKIRNVTISNNNIRNRYIELRVNTGGNTNIENVLVTGNTVSVFNGTGRCVKLELDTTGGASSGSIKRTSIVGNNIYIKNGALANGNAVELETEVSTTGTIDETFIFGNHIDSDDKGVFLQIDGGDITDVVVQGNIFDAINVIETDAYDDSIYFSDNTVLTCTSVLEIVGTTVALFTSVGNNIKAGSMINGGPPTATIVRDNILADVFTHGIKTGANQAAAGAAAGELWVDTDDNAVYNGV
jgi:hypothetical protein